MDQVRVQPVMEVEYSSQTGFDLGNGKDLYNEQPIVDRHDQMDIEKHLDDLIDRPRIMEYAEFKNPRTLAS